MAGRRLDDTALRLRRATRHDLAGVRALMAADDTGRSERFDRRVLRQLGGTVAVVEDATGAIVGAVSLAAVRSFRAGHWCAHLDGVWMAPAHAGAVGRVVDAAVRMAARRNCHEVLAFDPLSPEVTAALTERGAVAVAGWRLPITPEPAPARGPRRRRRS